MNSIEVQYPYFSSNVFPMNKVVIADIISKIQFDYYLCRYMMTLIIWVGGCFGSMQAQLIAMQSAGLVPYCGRDSYQAQVP